VAVTVDVVVGALLGEEGVELGVPLGSPEAVNAGMSVPASPSSAPQELHRTETQPSMTVSEWSEGRSGACDIFMSTVGEGRTVVQRLRRVHVLSSVATRVRKGKSTR